MKKVLISIFVIAGLSGYAQQDPLFTQYMFNKLVLNPAYAGAREILTVDLLDRAQWLGIDDAPQTLTFSAHTSIRNRKVGIGLHGYRDALGPSVNLGLMAAYSYSILFDYSYFSFGLQGGLKYFGFDWNQIRLKHPEDYYFMPQDIQRFTPDFNLGLYYQSRRYFVGLSSKQLLENEYGVIRSSSETNMACPRCSSPVTLGGGIEITKGLMFGSNPGELGSLDGLKKPLASHQA